MNKRTELEHAKLKIERLEAELAQLKIASSAQNTFYWAILRYKGKGLVSLPIDIFDQAVSKVAAGATIHYTMEPDGTVTIEALDCEGRGLLH